MNYGEKNISENFVSHANAGVAYVFGARGIKRRFNEVIIGTKRPSHKHLRSVPCLLGGPYTTICSCMKIARYGENCPVPSLRAPSTLHPGIYDFATCTLHRERGSRATEASP